MVTAKEREKCIRKVSKSKAHRIHSTSHNSPVTRLAKSYQIHKRLISIVTKRNKKHIFAMQCNISQHSPVCHMSFRREPPVNQPSPPYPVQVPVVRRLSRGYIISHSHLCCRVVCLIYVHHREISVASSSIQLPPNSDS